MSFQSGAEVWVAAGFDALRGKRVGLITNHTAIVHQEPLVDYLAQRADIQLVALFGPEHGVRTEAAAGEAIADGKDPVTGIPVHSLFGKTKKPLPAMLQGIEALLFDIQDVGARFYTYISTLGYAMQAAAEAHIPLWVLDRPNPLGGTRMEGPVLQPGNESFIGLYPIPIRHGLTIGEIARAIHREQWLPGLETLKLEVVPMQGWQRHQQWEDIGLRWIPPSPNLPSLAAAQAYPGTCLFEGTLASEGRGTTAPFLQIGAPWAKPELLWQTLQQASLPGVTFSPQEFTPQTIPGKAHNPKFNGMPIGGIARHVTDSLKFSPVACGIHLLRAFLALAPEPEHFFHEAGFSHLAGNRDLAHQLLRGTPPTEIVDSWEPALQDFPAYRQPWLLY